MTITFECRCGSHFEITSKSKNKGSFVCQNCGRELPGQASDYAKEMLTAYNKLSEEIQRVELYGFKIT